MPYKHRVGSSILSHRTIKSNIGICLYFFVSLIIRNMKNKKITWALVLNFVIVVGMITGIIIDAVVSKQYHDSGDERYEPFFLNLKYYTVLSNIILFVAASIFIVYTFLVLKKKIKKIPNWVSIFKMCATTGTTITMFVVLFILTPGLAAGLGDESLSPSTMYVNASSIYHVVNPLAGLLTFILFETNRKIEFKHCCFGMIFTIAYSIFYALEAYLHFLPEQYWPAMSYDWYGFVGVVGDYGIAPLLIGFAGFSFLVTWLLRLANQKIHILEKPATK